MVSAMSSTIAVTVWFVLFVIYIIPGVVATARGHKHAAAVWALNILLGWTLLGWIVALVWALMRTGK